jgi:hypothetical protein
MKRPRPEKLEKLARALAQVLTVAFALLGCSEDPPPELAEGTFGGEHREQIEYNCDNAIACAMEDEPVHEGAFDECVIREAGKLNVASPEAQLSFLVAFARCGQLSGCDFVMCGQAGGMGFGQQQIAKVQHKCQAQVQCASEMGTPVPDPAGALETCILQTIIYLDPLPGAQRQSFQDSYWPCAQLQGCAFDQCFPY